MMVDFGKLFAEPSTDAIQVGEPWRRGTLDPRHYSR
jgi:hypothetical protein